MGWAVPADAGKSDSPQSQGTIEYDGAYGGGWFVDLARKLTAIALINTPFEGMAGVFPIDVRVRFMAEGSRAAAAIAPRPMGGGAGVRTPHLRGELL